MEMNVPLRETMLDAHREEVKRIYLLPEHSDVAYNESSTQICVDGVPLFEVVRGRMRTAEFRNRLRSERAKRRKAVYDGVRDGVSAEEQFHRQFDYELLALDHAFDMETVMSFVRELNGIDRIVATTVLTSPARGVTFYGEVEHVELECVGAMLEGAHKFYFSGVGFEYFVKKTATRDKLMRIILQHDDVRKRLWERFVRLPQLYRDFSTADEVFDALKERRIDQMRFRGTRAMLLGKFDADTAEYLSFMGEVLDYNEENRLLRSMSFYHIMKDRTIPERFEELVGVRKNGGKQ